MNVAVRFGNKESDPPFFFPCPDVIVNYGSAIRVLILTKNDNNVKHTGKLIHIFQVCHLLLHTWHKMLQADQDLTKQHDW